jgi:Tfp pilus assembly PilM family ATPase
MVRRGINQGKTMSTQKAAVLGPVLSMTRRFAAGIDISEHAVRLAVISRRMRANARVCVEHLESVALDAGAVVAGSIVDRPAVTVALAEAFGRLPARSVWRGLRCAMALPSSATLTTHVPLSRLIRQQPRHRDPERNDPFGLLEPAVLAEAERAAGIERGALAVDWTIEAREDGCAEVAIAATSRQYVESRIETAAAAGIVLCSIDGEPAAALRAMRHAAATELGAQARFVACWLESSGMHAWLVGEDGVEHALRYPAPEYAGIADAFRELIDERAPPGWILVGGDIHLLAQAGMPATSLARTFGCVVLPFECGPFCNGAEPIEEASRGSPLFAVAFGLALREVMP